MALQRVLLGGGAGPRSKPDAEAHTNPVYVYVDGKAPYQQDDLDWLSERVREQIDAIKKDKPYEEKDRAIKFFEESREELR